ncbi:MAG TPA: YggS family pyridoxal phosphate-dependent enzyme [Candidatus Acidoferrales bacterium]
MEQAGALTITDAIGRLQERIEAARQRAGRRDEVTLVAVTKQVPVERIAEAYRAGVRHFGENRVQEFEDKHRLLVLPSATWHMVGHLQSNKAGQALELFDCVDSLDSLHLAQKLDKAAAEQGKRLPVLIQVHLGDEPSKHGVEPASLAALAEQLAGLPHLAVEGLMTIPPFLEPAERLRPFFHRLRELAEELEQRRLPGVSIRRLSMGMTHDFELAIEEGATEVRLGTALFGPRPAR